jgi:hypothetical protein
MVVRVGNHVFWASIVLLWWLYFRASFVRPVVLLWSALKSEVKY